MSSKTDASVDDKTPYTATQVKTIEISGPIKIILTTKTDSSHVPPPQPPGDDDGEVTVNRLMEALRPLAQAILQKLEEIQQSQNPQ